MTKTKRNIIIIVAAVVAAIGITLAIVLPLTLNKDHGPYTVTFDSNGGSAVESITDVKRNSLITKPADPTKLNHKFEGWHKDDRLTKLWNFETDKVTSNITLYAKWTYNETVGLNLMRNGNEYTVAGIGNVTDENILIPETHEGLPVTTIAQNAFKDVASIKTVYVPSSVKNIKSGAFSGCSELTDVTLPDNLTVIESELFSHCDKLRNVNIPDSVTSIGQNAFSSCQSLTEISLPAKLETLGLRAFSNCTGIERLSVKAGSSKFISRVNGQESNCIIEVFSKKIEGKEDPITVNRIVVGCKNSVIPTDRTVVIGEDSFCGCNTLTSISIPSNVIEIEDGAFNGCKGLTQITIPASVTRIGDYAFSSCESLQRIEFAAPAEGSENTGIQELGQEAFAHCYSLSPGLNLPASLTKVGAGLLYGCDFNRLTIVYGDDASKLQTLIQAEKDGNDDIFTTAVSILGARGSSAIVNGLA